MFGNTHTPKMSATSFQQNLLNFLHGTPVDDFILEQQLISAMRLNQVRDTVEADPNIRLCKIYLRPVEDTILFARGAATEFEREMTDGLVTIVVRIHKSDQLLQTAISETFKDWTAIRSEQGEDGWAFSKSSPS